MYTLISIYVMIHTNIFYITTNNKTKFNHPEAQVTLCTKLRFLFIWLSNILVLSVSGEEELDDAKRVIRIRKRDRHRNYQRNKRQENKQ